VNHFAIANAENSKSKLINFKVQILRFQVKQFVASVITL